MYVSGNIEKRNMANTEKDHHLNITNAIEVGDITATAIVAHVPVIVNIIARCNQPFNVAIFSGRDR